MSSVGNRSRPEMLRAEIARLVREYHRERFANAGFQAGTDLVHYAGRVFDAEELCNLVDASLDFFLTANRYAERFEAEFADTWASPTRCWSTRDRRPTSLR